MLLQLLPLIFAPAYVVRPKAPASLREMGEAGALVVWDGASEATIWGSPQANHAFRAWHDWHHWTGGLGFDLLGEAEVCARQCRDVFDRWGMNAVTLDWAGWLDAEVNGQVAYALATGAFPTDQPAFDAAWRVQRKVRRDDAWGAN